MIASVGSTMEGSGASSTRTSPAAYITVARMGVFFRLLVSDVRGLRNARGEALMVAGGIGAASAVHGNGDQRDEAEQGHDDADGGRSGLTERRVHGVSSDRRAESDPP